jgi:polar amino acid transport system permease protein
MEWSIIWNYREALFHGLLQTLQLAVIGIPCTFVLGLMLGCVASLPGPYPREIVSYFVAPMRNIPIIVKLFVFYFVLGMDALPASLLTLILHHSAYICDITTAGFRSIPREQVEAAGACGHSYPQIFRYVLLPQAIRIIKPPLTSQFVDVVKNSSVCMVVGIQDLTFQTQEIAHYTFRGFEAATAVSILYLIITTTIAFGMGLSGHTRATKR